MTPAIDLTWITFGLCAMAVVVFGFAEMWRASAQWRRRLRNWLRDGKWSAL